MDFYKDQKQVVKSMPYVGRFAPSPTGKLHIGSLIAATASYLEAKANDGRWLLRIEDVDEVRNELGAAESIVRVLEGFGFEWDDEIVFQHDRYDRYQSAFTSLIESGLVYPCSCSRKKILTSGVMGVDGVVYPGLCREGLRENASPRAWRLRVPDGAIQFVDAIQGVIRQNLAKDVGDFVLLRADGCWAYQLAVVIDDAAYGVTHIVRGADLLDSTPRQIGLQQCLNLPLLQYTHIPILANLQGEKLSKQTKAPALLSGKESIQLFQVLALLGQNPPQDLYGADLNLLWSWAFESWDLAKIPKKRSISVTFKHKSEYKILL